MGRILFPPDALEEPTMRCHGLCPITKAQTTFSYCTTADGVEGVAFRRSGRELAIEFQNESLVVPSRLQLVRTPAALRKIA